MTTHWRVINNFWGRSRITYDLVLRRVSISRATWVQSMSCHGTEYYQFDFAGFFPREKCTSRENSVPPGKKSSEKHRIFPLIFSSRTTFYPIPTNNFRYEHACPPPSPGSPSSPFPPHHPTTPHQASAHPARSHPATPPALIMPAPTRTTPARWGPLRHLWLNFPSVPIFSNW